MLKRKPVLKLVPKVDEEFSALIAPLSAEEYQQLEANLISEGCRDSLVLWRGLLLDGHNRLAICNRHGIPYDTAEIELPDRETAKLWIEENQIGRRNLSNDQQAALAYRIMQRRVSLSKKRRAAKAGASHGSGRILVVHGSHQEMKANHANGNARPKPTAYQLARYGRLRRLPRQTPTSLLALPTAKSRSRKQKSSCLSVGGKQNSRTH
jgi:hypothetical protein